MRLARPSPAPGSAGVQPPGPPRCTLGKQQHQIQDGGQQEADEGKSHSPAPAGQGAASWARGPSGGSGLLGVPPPGLPPCVAPPPPRSVRGLRQLTGRPRPQPGRELQASLVAAAGSSRRPGASIPLRAWRGPSTRGGRLPDLRRRSCGSRARRPQIGRPWGRPERWSPGREPAPRSRPALGRSAPGSESRSAPPQLGRLGGLGWGRKEEAGRRKLGQFLMGRLKLLWVVANCRLMTAESHSGQVSTPGRRGVGRIAAQFSFPIFFSTLHLVIPISFP